MDLHNAPIKIEIQGFPFRVLFHQIMFNNHLIEIQRNETFNEYSLGNSELKMMDAALFLIFSDLDIRKNEISLISSSLYTEIELRLKPRFDDCFYGKLRVN